MPKFSNRSALALRILLAAACAALTLILWPKPIVVGFHSISTVMAVFGVVALIKKENLIFCVVEAIGTIAGAFLIGSIFVDTMFRVRDGNYIADSIIPSRITGAVIGWLIVAILVRWIRYVIHENPENSDSSIEVRMLDMDRKLR